MKMNKWITISAISVLAILVIVTGVLYAQENSRLKDARTEIDTLEGNVSALESNVSTLETDLAAAQAEVTRLDGELTAAQAEVTRLDGELTAAQAQVSTLETDLAAAEAQVSTLETDLAAAEAQVSTLEVDLTAAEAQARTLQADLADAEARVTRLSEELKTVNDPRHFESVEELGLWLLQDDTDTVYADRSFAELSFILQVRALRDGYLLPAYAFIFEGEDVGLNYAWIGVNVYVIFPEDDFVFQVDSLISPLPLHPLPLD